VTPQEGAMASLFHRILSLLLYFWNNLKVQKVGVCRTFLRLTSFSSEILHEMFLSLLLPEVQYLGHERYLSLVVVIAIDAMEKGLRLIHAVVSFPDSSASSYSHVKYGERSVKTSMAPPELFHHRKDCHLIGAMFGLNFMTIRLPSSVLLLCTHSREWRGIDGWVEWWFDNVWNVFSCWYMDQVGRSCLILSYEQRGHNPFGPRYPELSHPNGNLNSISVVALHIERKFISSMISETENSDLRQWYL